MLRIDQLRLHPGQQETLLRARCAKLLRVAPADITACTVLRKSIDAREDLTLVYTVSVSVKNEAQVLRRCRDKRVSVYKQEVYFLPPPVTAPAVRPIVVGAGPAGLFAALVLARCGARPILLERGRPVEHRQADVERFWSGGPLDPDSNVQFGEGGAGAFSDGKLNTGTKDLRHRFILETLVRHWTEGPGGVSNPDRAEAFSLVQLASDVQEAIDLVEARTGQRPVLLGTSARDNGVMTPLAVRNLLADRPVLLLFGTGHGMAPEILDACDGVLRPLRWMDGYNHLPVRGAVAITLDRVLGDCC